jgi:hypothetical protein
MTPVQADGSFEIRGVGPGAYNLTATAMAPDGQQYTGRTRVDVVNADIRNVTVAIRAGIDVQGRVIPESQPPAQFRMSQLRVTLVPEDSPFGTIAFNPSGARLVSGAFLSGGVSATVAEDGTFTLQNMGTSEYRVSVTGLPAGAYVEAARLGSADALSAPFTVSDPRAPLQIQVAFTPGRVSGIVVDAKRNPVAGAVAVLVPDEARRGRSELYFSASTDTSGQFNLTSVPAGNYKVFAWEDAPTGAWQYPDFIRRFEDRGQPIGVSRNGALTVEVRLIPAGN